MDSDDNLIALVCVFERNPLRFLWRLNESVPKEYPQETERTLQKDYACELDRQLEELYVKFEDRKESRIDFVSE